MHIDLKRLRHAVAVAETGSFSGAAKLLNLTQPALSRSIITLEEMIGITIFDRNVVPIDLTPTGVLVIQEAKELINKSVVMENNLRMLRHGDRGQVSFGMGPALASSILAELICKSASDMPDVKLNARVLVGHNAQDLHHIEAVIEGVVDFTLCPRITVPLRNDLIIEEMGTIPARLIVRRDHPLESDVTVNQARQYPHATIDFASSQMIASPLESTISCNDYDAMVKITLRSDTISFLSPFLVLDRIRDGSLRTITLNNAEYQTSLESVLVRKAGRMQSSAAIRVADHAKQLIGELWSEWRELDTSRLNI